MLIELNLEGTGLEYLGYFRKKIGSDIQTNFSTELTLVVPLLPDTAGSDDVNDGTVMTKTRCGAHSLVTAHSHVANMSELLPMPA